ncbi:hypothetical protein L2E82_11615 [Cichorium intybus]|uniref:Uncharacterized protein n=1 Tax=Cichorium intybus TaxID=13427 RepID=A0ACB9GDN7_CICIN|nr:hypothetical protein L2E82_11615 [Cichorium intybus]
MSRKKKDRESRHFLINYITTPTASFTSNQFSISFFPFTFFPFSSSFINLDHHQSPSKAPNLTRFESV